MNLMEQCNYYTTCVIIIILGINVYLQAVAAKHR